MTTHYELHLNTTVYKFDNRKDALKKMLSSNLSQLEYFHILEITTDKNGKIIKQMIVD